MTDLYLRFNDEAECLATLFDAPDEDGNRAQKYRNVDIIGVIYKPTGAMTTVDGMEIPEMAPLPGHHANVRLSEGEDSSALTPFSVAPSQPVRVWA